MKRSDLSHTIRETLVRLPPPYDSHYGIVPPPPPEDGVAIAQATKSLDEARGALGKIDAIASQMKCPYIVSRVLTRREAVSSSSIEGTQSTLDEILSVEETGGDDAQDAARQVRNYAVALDELGSGRRESGIWHFHRRPDQGSSSSGDAGRFRLQGRSCVTSYTRRVGRRRRQHRVLQPQSSPSG